MAASSQISLFLKNLKTNSQSTSATQSYLAGLPQLPSNIHFLFLRWIICDWSLGQENFNAGLWKVSKRHYRNISRQRSSYSKQGNRCQRLRRSLGKKLFCEAHSVLSQADTASVWQETSHFWQYHMMQENMRKSRQLHCSSFSSPSLGYIECLENLDLFILKVCSNCQFSMKIVWDIKNKMFHTQVPLTKIRIDLWYSESIKTFFLSRQFIIW